MRVGVLAVLALCECSWGLRVVGPPSVVSRLLNDGDIPTSKFSNYLGSSDFSSDIVNGTIYKFSTLCRTTIDDNSSLRRKLLFWDVHSDTCSPPALLRHLEQFEVSGVIVVQRKPISRPGFAFNLRFDDRSPSNIPILEIVFDDFKKSGLFDILSQNQDVEILLEPPSKSEYEARYDRVDAFIFWRVVIPVLNAIFLVDAVRCLISLFRAQRIPTLTRPASVQLPDNSVSTLALTQWQTNSFSVPVDGARAVDDPLAQLVHEFQKDLTPKPAAEHSYEDGNFSDSSLDSLAKSSPKRIRQSAASSAMSISTLNLGSVSLPTTEQTPRGAVEVDYREEAQRVVTQLNMGTLDFEMQSPGSRNSEENQSPQLPSVKLLGVLSSPPSSHVRPTTVPVLKRSIEGTNVESLASTDTPRGRPHQSIATRVVTRGGVVIIAVTCTLRFLWCVLDPPLFSTGIFTYYTHIMFMVITTALSCASMACTIHSFRETYLPHKSPWVEPWLTGVGVVLLVLVPVAVYAGAWLDFSYGASGMVEYLLGLEAGLWVFWTGNCCWALRVLTLNTATYADRGDFVRSLWASLWANLSLLLTAISVILYECVDLTPIVTQVFLALLILGQTLTNAASIYVFSPSMPFLLTSIRKHLLH